MKVIALLFLFFLVSCVKEHTCVCKNSIATYDAGKVDKTKSQAKKYCQSLSSGDTSCDIK
jgi:hypothetical protein